MKKILVLITAIVFSLNLDLTANSANNIKIDGRELILDNQIQFDTGVDTIRSESIPALISIRDYLNDKKYISLLRIEGHVSAGDDAKSQDISSRRALAVATWLIDNGVDCKRLIAVGFGNTKPVQTLDTTTAEASSEANLNNRISFYLAALRGKLISGLPADGGGLPVPNLCTEAKR